MARIQLRRDTSTNWSTNNPTPLAGEPCFETDTGKLKIGDGSTAYNDLAYQGGGSTYELPVASSTTLGGVKIDNQAGLIINSSSGLLSLARTIPNQTTFSGGIVCNGTNSFTTVNPVTIGSLSSAGKGILQVKTGDYESYVKMGYNSTGRGTFKGIMTHTGNQVRTTYGIYSVGTQSVDAFEIKGYIGVDITPEIGTTNVTASTLSIKPNSLTFTKSDNTVVDLLAGGGGSGDVSAAGNNTFTGINTFNEPIQLKSVQNTLKIETHSEQVDSEKVDFNCPTIASSTGDIYLNPIAMLELENSSGGTVTREGRIVNGSNGEVIPSINDNETSSTKTWSSKKLSKLSNLTLADASNASMPSSNISSFEIGASGTTYIAPSDGYIVARARFSSIPNSIELYSLNNSNQTLLSVKTERTQNGINEAYIPIAGGMTFGYKYEGELNTTSPFHSLYIVQTIGG